MSNSMHETCTYCGLPLEEGQIGLCDECIDAGETNSSNSTKETTMNTPIQLAALAALDAFVAAITAPLIARIEVLEDKESEVGDIRKIIDEQIKDALEDEDALNELINTQLEEFDFDDKVKNVIKHRLDFTIEVN